MEWEASLCPNKESKVISHFLIKNFMTSLLDLLLKNRKKLLDLYQRYSVSSYCTAFSYKPLFDEKILNEIDYEANANKILQCPPNYCEKISNLHGDLLCGFSNLYKSDSENSSNEKYFFLTIFKFIYK